MVHFPYLPGNHFTSKDVSCDQCEFNFCFKIGLQNHMKVNHPGVELTVAQKFIECEICHEENKTKMNDNQIQKHTDERPYKCDIEGCHMTFITKKGLDIHKIFHNYPVKCDVCRKLVKSLKTHQNCPGSFQLQKLRKEFWIRKYASPGRRYKCRIGDCQRSFYTPSTFSTHKKWFHSPPVKCNVCGRIVKYLKHHQKRVCKKKK